MCNNTAEFEFDVLLEKSLGIYKRRRACFNDQYLSPSGQLNYLLLVGNVQLGEFLEPGVGTVDLAAWLELAEFAVLVVGKVSLGPLAEARGDLLDTAEWVRLVVSAELGVFGFVTTIKRSSLTGWATVWELVLVVEAASSEAGLESGNVVVESLTPVGGLALAQVVVAPLSGEGVELGQTLKGVSWWDLLVFGRSGGDESDGESFHLWYFFEKGYSFFFLCKSLSEF